MLGVLALWSGLQKKMVLAFYHFNTTDLERCDFYAEHAIQDTQPTKQTLFIRYHRGKNGAPVAKKFSLSICFALIGLDAGKTSQRIASHVEPLSMPNGLLKIGIEKMPNAESITTEEKNPETRFPVSLRDYAAIKIAAAMLTATADQSDFINPDYAQ